MQVGEFAEKNIDDENENTGREVRILDVAFFFQALH